MKYFPSIIFAILFLSSFLSAYAQDTVVYCVDLKRTDFEHYNVLNQDIEGKKVIMIGENHRMGASAIIQADLFMHLNKRFGVRHLLIEFGRAEAYLYNQYLQTGDEWYLNHTFHGYKRYKESFSGWKKLYDYNSGLDASKKLVVHGLDVEREPGLSATMYKLLSVYEDNPQIKGLINSVKIRLDTIGIVRKPQDFVDYLTDRILAVSLPEDENKKIIDEILYTNPFLSNFSDRDKCMAETFMQLDSTNEVFLGQFGFAHAMLDNKRYLAGILNSHEKYHNKVLAIHMYYGDSTRSSFMNDISDCSNFLFRIDPSNKALGTFRYRMHWLFYSRNRILYTTRE